MTTSASNQKLIGVNQWVTSIANIESKSNVNIQHLQSILGPVKEKNSYELATDKHELELESSLRNDGYFTHEIVFQIEEKMFIESIKFYEKVCTDSSLMRIEALNLDANEPTWVPIWTTDRPLPPIKRPTVFIPTITPTLFKTDSIKIIISGSIVLIDAIGK